jgi:GxxExxY protein
VSQRKEVFMEFDPLSKEIIGCAIEVHKLLGPGLLESAYEECLVYELLNKSYQIDRQKPIPVMYKNIRLDCGYRLDLLVEKRIIVELKSIDEITLVHEAQILTYMRFSNIKIGLLINFNVTLLKNGLKRFVL